MLLETLEPGRYCATGAYHPESSPKTGFPVEWDGTLSRESYRASIEGKYRHHAGATEHPFSLVLTFPSGVLERGSFDLRSTHLGRVTGAFRALGGGVVFGGRVEKSGAALSLNIEVLRPGVLDGKGTLVFGDGAIWLYQFEVLSPETRLAKADVVSILGGRRA